MWGSKRLSVSGPLSFAEDVKFGSLPRRGRKWLQLTVPMYVLCLHKTTPSDCSSKYERRGDESSVQSFSNSSARVTWASCSDAHSGPVGPGGAEAVHSHKLPGDASAHAADPGTTLSMAKCRPRTVSGCASEPFLYFNTVFNALINPCIIHYLVRYARL